MRVRLQLALRHRQLAPSRLLPPPSLLPPSDGRRVSAQEFWQRFGVRFWLGPDFVGPHNEHVFEQTLQMTRPAEQPRHPGARAEQH